MICEGEFDRLVLEANRFKAGCERLSYSQARLIPQLARSFARSQFAAQRRSQGIYHLRHSKSSPRSFSSSASTSFGFQSFSRLSARATYLSRMGSINSLGYCPFFKVSLKPELAQPPAAAIGHEMKATAVSYVKSLLLFSSRDPQLAQDISNRKQTGGPSREGPPVAGVIRPQLFCEFYLQPIYPRSVR
jgi:hypothetical protein